MANEHLKTCPTSLDVRKMQIKPNMRYHFTPTRVAKIKDRVTQCPGMTYSNQGVDNGGEKEGIDKEGYKGKTA